MDSVGPMARCVQDAAILLSVLAGKDPLDPATLGQPDPVPDYLGALRANAFEGARIGVVRELQDEDANIARAFDEAVDVMRGLGAEIGQSASLSFFEKHSF